MPETTPDPAAPPTPDEARPAMAAEPEQAETPEMPGDSVCWLRLVCTECGAIAEAEPPAKCPQCGALIEPGL